MSPILSHIAQNPGPANGLSLVIKLNDGRENVLCCCVARERGIAGSGV